MDYRLNKDSLLDILQQWNQFLRRKVRLIACGGTAMTLLNVKESTKDVDFMVPDAREYAYLIKQLKELGYKPFTGAGWRRDGEIFIFDLFQGKKIHTTELCESPLNVGNHLLFKEYSRLYVGILNYYDLISSKILRGTTVDMDDCELLFRARKDEINIATLTDHYRELASYDTSFERVKVHIDYFIERLHRENLL
jgi:hypothetical protein